MMMLRSGAILEPDLENLIFLRFCGFCDRSCIVDCRSERSFAIEMFARFESGNCDLFVLMSWSCEKDSLDFGIVENGSIIIGRLRIRCGPAAAPEVGRIRFADRVNDSAWSGGEDSDQFAAPCADAD